MKTLDLPKEAIEDGGAVEFLRAWVSQGGDITFVSLGDIWEDAGAIGIFFADLLRHFVENSHADPEEKRLRVARAARAFAAELEV